MQFINLKAQYQTLKPDIDKAIERVLSSSAFIGGEAIESLEQELATYTNHKYCITCANGTDALILSMTGLNIGEGDEVITTPFSFFASSEAISRVGATPVFVDIEPGTLHINAKEIRAKITSKTRAILPVGLFGQSADMKHIKEIGEHHQISIIEDAAQSFGATYFDKPIGAFADVTCTSFYPAKPLGCYGDGGAIFTNNAQLADQLKLLRNHGQNNKYQHQCIGHNSRLDALQAAILSVKLKAFPHELRQRETIAQKYDSAFSNNAMITTPKRRSNSSHTYAQYSILIHDIPRQVVMDSLSQQNIPTVIHYPLPIYRQPAYKTLEIDSGEYPVTAATCDQILSLPMCAYLSENDQDRVITAINHITKSTI